MAEEGDSRVSKKMNVTSIGNSWIVCRSQTHPGRVYYFNTLTGEAAWNLSEAEIEKAHFHTKCITGQSDSHIGDCPEPTEPPGESVQGSNHQKVTQKTRGPRIYNKQIINNQFAKPYSIAPFANPSCQCQTSSSTNDITLAVAAAPLYNPNIWTIPPQVILAPTVPALDSRQQPILNGFNSTPLQNTSVPLSNRFQIINELANSSSSHFQAIHRIGPKFPNSSWKNQVFMSRMNKHESNNDLRNILSARRKFIRTDMRDRESQKTYRDSGKDSNDVDHNSEIMEEDLYPSDIDNEWLQEYAFLGDPKLKTDLWRLASGDLKQDFCIIMASSGVLLNNIKFLTTLIQTDKQIYLMTPLAVLKQLRSATGSSSARLVARARAAIRFAAQQMNKVPAFLKGLQGQTVETCCLSLTQQKYHIVLLVDKNELQILRNIGSIPTFTVEELKKYFSRSSYPSEPQPLGNITVTVTDEPSNDSSTECLKKDAENLLNKSAEAAPSVDEHLNEIKCIDNKKNLTEQGLLSSKQTVSVSVQTDFELPQLTDSLSQTTSFGESLDIDSALEEHSAVETSSVEIKTIPKKIRLKRNISSNSEPITTQNGQFKWRKRKHTAPTPNSTSKLDVDAKKHSSLPNRSPLSPSLSNSNMTMPKFEQAVNCNKIMEISDTLPVLEVNEKALTEDISPSGVQSESVDTDIDLNGDNGIVTNETVEESQEITIFEVAGDLMNEYLSRGCDEWLSRFVQIIEEALTQILQQEPHFSCSSMPPPWSIQEATLCTRRKYENNKKITFACDKFLDVLFRISDSRGKIPSDLNPSDFMHMYSYGVYLINTLQTVLKDSEDLQIAADSLSRLLNDIKNPNMDVSHNVFMDLLNTSDKHAHTHNDTNEEADIEENILSTTTGHKSPEKQIRLSTKNSSPVTNLTNKGTGPENIEKKKEEETKIIRKIDIDYSFFSNLKQKTNNFSDNRAIITFPNFALDATFAPSPIQQISLESEGPLNGECPDAEKEGREKPEPKITRIFNKCLEFEEKLKNKTNEYLDFGSDHFAIDNNYSGNEFYFEDVDYNYDFDVYNRETYTEEKYCKSSGTHYINDDVILQWLMERTMLPVQKILVNLHRFCKETCRDLKTKYPIDQDFKKNVMEKTVKAIRHTNGLCKHLNSILYREDTKAKFRDVMKELGIEDFEMDDSQVAEYGATVEKFLSQVNLLSESLNLIALAIEEK